MRCSPRKPLALRTLILRSACVCLLLTGTHAELRAQQSATSNGESQDTARGIKLYQQDDTLGAIEALRTGVKQHKNDGNAWLYLGLAFNRRNNTKDARKAFEAAVKLLPNSPTAYTGLAYTLVLTNKTREAARAAEHALLLNPQIAEAHYVLGLVRLRDGEQSNALKEAEAALSIKADLAPALLLKSQTLLGVFAEENVLPDSTSSTNQYVRLKESAASLEKYLHLNPQDKDTALWREQLETMRVYAQLADKDTDLNRTVFTSKELTTKARIVSRPEPHYTEAARAADISGEVMLRAILAGDGSVKHILVLRALSHGLTQEAIKAAQQIKFEPATKDGRTVSQVVTIVYNFSIY